MARIPKLEYDDAGPEARAEFDKIVAEQGRLTNMKQSLGHSPAALRALMQWYPLRDTVQPFLGQRATTLFVHAISSATDCLICSTFFRRYLIDSGENPDRLEFDDREQAVVDFGRQLVRDPNAVSDELFARLAKYFQPNQIVALTAFGALMIATNVFNNALRVDLDDYLQPYRRGGELDPERSASSPAKTGTGSEPAR
ncbi:MAG: carboxymuconolactone decarboxylase family protein [Pirellulales bacterium]